MGYSRQSSDGVTVENKDGVIFVNGKRVGDAKIMYNTKLHTPSVCVGYLVGMLLGFLIGLTI